MPDQMKNMLIGIFVVAAAAIVIFVLMFIHPSVGDETQVLRVRFANIDKISVGTRVTFAGKPVGEVVEIRELPEVDTERKSVNGYIYVYELTLRVDSGVRVFNTDQISARSSGLLGDKSVAIIPYPPKPDEELHIVNDEVLYATESGSVEDALKDVKDVGDKLEKALDNINEAFASLQENKFWENLTESATHIRGITAALNQPKLISDSLTNVHKITTNFNGIATKINTGQGTIGKFINSDDFYVRFVALTNKAETILNDVNHYGVLFHLDKGWQRMRARRLNLMQRLQTPQEFRNFFNDEVDQVSTSIARVSMVLDQMHNLCLTDAYDMMQNPEFVKVYAELIRRVEAIDESIKMYNQQVVDTSLHQTELIEVCY